MLVEVEGSMEETQVVVYIFRGVWETMQVHGLSQETQMVVEGLGNLFVVVMTIIMLSQRVIHAKHS